MSIGVDMPLFNFQNNYVLFLFYLMRISLYSTPPPPEISNYNISIPEASWNENTHIYVSGREGLHGYPDKVKGITIDHSDFYLNGYTLKVGEEGINSGGGFVNIWGAGSTTAIGDTLIFHPNSGVENALRIEGSIVNNLKGRVGILVKNHSNYGFGIVRISGGYNSNFTGDSIVEGRSSHLYLGKMSGLVAIRGNIYVRDGGLVGLEGSNQIADSSTVTLQGKGSAFSLNDVSWSLSEKFHSLVVEGEGRVMFWRSGGTLYRKTLIVDDLIIRYGASLAVTGWRSDLDLFLIKKNGRSLWEMRALLNKIHFDGPNRQIVELRDYDGTHWKLYASPEPSTYGAILGGAALVLVAWRRRRPGGKAGRV